MIIKLMIVEKGLYSYHRFRALFPKFVIFIVRSEQHDQHEPQELLIVIEASCLGQNVKRFLAYVACKLVVCKKCAVLIYLRIVH